MWLVGLAAWAYAVLIVTWFVLHLVIPDRLPWLALVSTFAPYLFAPLLLLLPLGLAVRARRLWLPLGLPLLVFAVEYGALFDFGLLARGPAPDEPITIVTFNAWGYSRSPATARAILGAGTPDLVVLQELSGPLAAVLEQELGETYPYRLLQPDRRKGILSRYPLVDVSPGLPAELRWFTQAAEVQVGTRRLTVYNVHLYATTVLSDLEAGNSVAAGLVSAAAEREQQALSLAADVAARSPAAVVAGDLNATDQSRAYRLLTRHLGDAHRQAGQGLGHTFPAYSGSFRGFPIPRRTVRIDFVLYSDELRAVDSRVLPDHGESDHLPVWARLSWAQPARP